MLPRATELAWEWVRQAVRPGEVVVDATAGNGRDCLMLARLVGPAGRVLAFDVQDVAVAATRRALALAGMDDGRVTVVHGSHARLAEHVGPGQVAAVMFNLGYLPGSDQRVVTEPAAALAGIEAGLGALRSGGVLTVVAYPGHAGGAGEAAAIIGRLARLDPAAWQVRVMRTHNTARPAPVLAGARRIG
jgi:hypothetical protein